MPEEKALRKTMSDETALSVTEAAQRLGVSERTIYRMLQKGKLQRTKTSDRRTLIVGHDANYKTCTTVEVSDTASDDELTRTIELLRSELALKDAQIADLMAFQKELTQNMNRLQEQMFELARLVLSQNIVTVRPTATETAGTTQEQDKSGLLAWLARFLDTKGEKR
jgi:excisionase family DNA binding protein